VAQRIRIEAASSVDELAFGRLHHLVLKSALPSA
jgi:hypothetical protein